MGQCQAPENTQGKEQMGINCHLLIMNSIFVIYVSVVILIGWVILATGILFAFLADLSRELYLLILLNSNAFELKLTKECFISMKDAADGFVQNLKFALMRGMSSTKQQKSTLSETPSTSSLEEMSQKYSDL